MSESTKEKTSIKKDKPDATAVESKPMGAMTVLERTAGIILSNRFIWLIIGLGLVLICQLTFGQWQSANRTGTPRFDTLDLMALFVVIIEGTLLLTSIVVVLSTPTVRKAWYKRYPNQKFSYIASGFSGILIIMLLQALLLVPILIFHQYPELVRESIRIPLMVLQRVMLIGLSVMITYNLMLLIKHIFRAPWWLCGVLGLAIQIGIGYLTTWISFTNKAYIRLNDIFYYNRLWNEFNWFPKLQSSDVFHNIQMPYFGYYLGVASIVAAATLLLWMPKASTLSSREITPTTTD